MSSQPTFHGWSRLPDKPQIRIPTYDLDIDCNMDAIHHYDNFEEHVMPLISTRNRRLADLALEVYYDINHFMTSSHLYFRLSSNSPCKTSS